MRMLSKTLASGPDGAWRIVLDQEELQLFIGFTEGDADPLTGTTVEDFLVIVPTSPLHREAQEQLVQLLRGWLAHGEPS